LGGKKNKKQKQGVCHTMALPFTLKKYLKAKEESSKKTSKRNQNPSRYYKSN
jgi:hypothetical protein